MSALRSSLARHVGQSPTDEAELRAMAAEAWHREGAVCVWPGKIRNPALRAAAQALGEAMYGPRDGEKQANG